MVVDDDRNRDSGGDGGDGAESVYGGDDYFGIADIAPTHVLIGMSFRSSVHVTENKKLNHVVGRLIS